MMDSIFGMLTPEIKEILASNFDAPQHVVQSGLSIATAATLQALAGRAGDTGFLAQIIGLASSASGQNILAGLASLTSGAASGAASDLVSRFLPLVFGSQQGQIIDAITQQAGVGASAAGGLMRVGGLLVLDYLAKMQSAGSLSISSLASALRAEVPSLQRYLPSWLLGEAANPLSSTETRADATGASVSAAAPARQPWPVPAAILGVLLLAFLVIRSLSGPSHSVTSAATAAWATLGDQVKVKLPDGTELNVPARGVELRLVSFLRGTSSGGSWATFDFDRLLFDSGKATLQPASDEQLNNIAAILKAYPGAQIQIGGYTDNSGDVQANVRLSEDRADSVMAELVKGGVDASRIDVKGYGKADPIADNSTEAGRQKNRRISLRVAEK